MRSNQQKKLLTEGFDPFSQMKQALVTEAPWETITDFATHKSFAGLNLYPRQKTLLKLIFLETENFTNYDTDVISRWAEGFKDPTSPEGVQPDIWERVDYLKRNGYRRFPHIQFVMGRRASKGVIGGVLGAEQLAYFYSLDDWQDHYGLPAGKEGYLNCLATTQTQAKRFQFADIRSTVEGCAYLQPAISTSREEGLTLRTPSDLRLISQMNQDKIPIEREIASLRVIPMSSNSSSGRGATSFGNIYDEMAHMISGTGSVKTSEEIYEAYQPSLDQFGRDSLTMVPSSPWCLIPGTKVLTEELDWVPVETLAVGDKLIGFDEYPAGGKGNARNWQPSEVTETSIIHAPTYTMKTRDGREVTSTGEHLWLVKRPYGSTNRGIRLTPVQPSNPRQKTAFCNDCEAEFTQSKSGTTTRCSECRKKNHRPRTIELYSDYDNPTQRWSWVKTSQLLPGDKIMSSGPTWDKDDSFEGGYVSGMFDGEGHLSGQTLGISQKPGAVMNTVLETLKKNGFTYHTNGVENIHDGECAKSCGCKVEKVRVYGGYMEIMRFLGTFKPQRLLPKFHDLLYGTKAYNKAWSGTTFDVVESVEYAGEQDVVALGTSTKTLLAEGLFSHNTQIGKFYELYKSGCVTLDEYNRKHDLQLPILNDEERDLNAEDGLKEVVSDPEMLVVQLPSWALYQDWEHSPDLGGPEFKRAIQYSPKGDEPENLRMARLKARNPEKFKVEREAQFATVIDSYLNPAKVDEMFQPFWGGRTLESQIKGRMDRTYRIHIDPATTNANFSLAIGHLEDSPEPDEHGEYWPHVIIDYLHVWKAKDFPDHTIDYTKVYKDLVDVLKRFPTTAKFTSDAWNSAAFLAMLRQEFGNRIKFEEASFSDKGNRERAEYFKSAINLGWIHAFHDDLYEGTEGSLLELELKFLSEKGNKVVKQEFGPVQTKDLADACMEVTVDLLRDHLDNWEKALFGISPAYGSTDVRAVRNGRVNNSLETFSRPLSSLQGKGPLSGGGPRRRPSGPSHNPLRGKGGW